MKRIRSGGAEIAYHVLGAGPPVVLLHPFPAHHQLWLAAAEPLALHYQIILPDLRGHGDSEAGEGPATMEKQAADIARVCDDAGVGRAAFAGVSIGGYVLFEFWRRYRARVAGFAFCDTRAPADTPESRANRLKSAEDVIERGTEPFIESMVPRLFGESTRRNRPDLVEVARRMMLKMSAENIAAVQRGMAQRPDSVSTLMTINVPTLVVVGEEDTLSPVADAELMRQHIPGAQLRVIPKAGHYAVFEQAAQVTSVLQEFLGTLRLGS
jgi:pimeloyl-ACP methyl ester carboxylesterase